jgi:tRNA U38,U39,U40 pseudouridine synthase TruA
LLPLKLSPSVPPLDARVLDSLLGEMEGTFNFARFTKMTQINRAARQSLERQQQSPLPLAGQEGQGGGDRTAKYTTPAALEKRRRSRSTRTVFNAAATAVEVGGHACAHLDIVGQSFIYNQIR